MFVAAIIALILTMILALTRALLGPTVFDRILAVNMFGTKTVLFLAVMSFLFDREDFIDLAMTYALINFIGVLAVLDFFQARTVRKAAEAKRTEGKA
ncbi:MAG: monovalent cation/H+ antiporter complex subunit F [Rhodothalassiaceae bacterium]